MSRVIEMMSHVDESRPFGASSRGGVNLLAISERLAIMPNRMGFVPCGTVGTARS